MNVDIYQRETCVKKPSIHISKFIEIDCGVKKTFDSHFKTHTEIDCAVKKTFDSHFKIHTEIDCAVKKTFDSHFKTHTEIDCAVKNPSIHISKFIQELTERYALAL